MPEFTEYHMANRTYRFVEAAPLVSLWIRLDLQRFHYENFSAAAVEGGIDVRVEVENGSSRGGDEIVEFYVRYEGDAFEKPHHKLVGFKRGMCRATRSPSSTITFRKRR